MAVTEMQVERTLIEGLYLIQMKQTADARGVVREFYRESSWRRAGLPSLGPLTQINLTESHQGVIRGLHGEAMNKLVAIASGEAFGAYVDTRPHSPSFRSVVTAALAPGRQVLVPDGVGNGFQSVSDGLTQYLYSFDREWAPGMAGTSINPLDPSLGIDWPIPVDPNDHRYLSERDRSSAPLH